MEEYLTSITDSAKRRTLERVRAIIKNASPGVEESIAYQIPAYRYHGVLVYFGAWKNHWALYPLSSAIKEAFHDQLSDYTLTKGGVQFPWDAPFPQTLIRQLIEARIAENHAAERKKTVKKPKNNHSR